MIGAAFDRWRLPGRALPAAALLLAGVGAALAQGDPGVMRRAADLRATPSASAQSLASLPAQAPVTRLAGREGAWIQVRTASGQTGWLHLFDVGSPGAADSSSSGAGQAASGGLRGLTSLFSRGSGAGGSTVATTTVGIRGLSAEDIANAQPDAAAVTRMEGLRQNETEARTFASNASLKSQTVEPLPAPGAPVADPGGRVAP